MSDVRCALDELRGVEELLLALMESPDQVDKSLHVLYRSVCAVTDELEAVSKPVKVLKAS